MLCNAIGNTNDLLFHVDYTKDDNHISLAAIKAILADKITSEIDKKIFYLSELIDKNVDFLIPNQTNFNNYHSQACKLAFCTSLPFV